jgi:ribose/xylose/arabinose/galactoside ABC-type transport system permease subunit
MSDEQPAESKKQRVDRELIELLNEVRIALPGVQVLFAFLLILPFQQAFSKTSSIDRSVYTVALLFSALAAALLIAPSAYHRINFRRNVKEEMLFDSNKLTIAGLACTAIGVACSIYLVVDVVQGGTAALLATFATLTVFASLWLAVPLARRGEPEP